MDRIWKGKGGGRGCPPGREKGGRKDASRPSRTRGKEGFFEPLERRGRRFLLVRRQAKRGRGGESFHEEDKKVMKKKTNTFRSG